MTTDSLPVARLAELDPRDVIFPIIGLGPNGGIRAFLGTGSVINDRSLLLTADHVIRDWDGPLAIALMSTLELHELTIVERDQSHDLALLRLNSFAAKYALSPQKENIYRPNHLLLTYEFGSTQTKGKTIQLSPATRLGHSTRRLDMQDRIGEAGDDALELSFPALRGSSGAPVLSNETFEVLGVIVANISYHLLPAQIATVLDNSNTILEETQFMLPQGVAVNIKHALPLLARAG